MTWCGAGAEWDVRFDAEGRVLKASVVKVWNQGGRTDQPDFN